MSLKLFASRLGRVIIPPVTHTTPRICASIAPGQIISCSFGTTPLVCMPSFFNKLSAERLWKSVTSVSNAGAKKGRGKGMGRKRAKDLNKGQVIGVGKINMQWPGLSAPIIRGREVLKQQRLPDDPERMQKLIKLRDSMTNFRLLKINPLERGFSGTKMPGRRLGPPDPLGQEKFDGFDSICLELRSLVSMKSTGRYRRYGALVVVGNGNGLAGFAVGKSKEMKSALRKAKNKAGLKLMHFDVYNGHTIYHNFFTQFGSTKLFVSQKNEGYGLVCHRVLRCVCQMIGIKDIHVKAEGAMNKPHIVKAFLIGLLKQRTHQQLAEEKKLHLVEFREENAFFPKVVASPSVVRTADEIPKDETLDFKQYVMDNRVVLWRKKYPRFYQVMPHYRLYLKKFEKRRHHRKLRHDLKVEYGDVKSFLSLKYPEEQEEKEA